MSRSKKTILVSGNAHDSGLALAMPYANAGENIILIIDEKESFDHEKFAAIKKIHPGIILHHIDMTDENTVKEVITEALNKFGVLDVLINNTGAEIDIDTTHLHPQQFDLMYALNVRSAFMLSKICHPWLSKSANPHIINISPPLDIDKTWFKSHLAFSMSSYSMSMCTLGMSSEFKKYGIAVNSIWPNKNNLSTFAEAVYALSQQNAANYSGNFCVQ